MTVCTQPEARRTVVRTGGCDQEPVGWRMIHPPQVHQLMDEDVIADPRGHQHQAPVQADVTVAPAGSPARALVANADARDDEAVARGQLVEARWKLARGALPMGALFGPLRSALRSILRIARQSLDPCALARHPFELRQCKRVRLAPRTAARDRHAQPSVGIDTEDVAACPWVTNVICRGDRSPVGAIGEPVGASALLVGAMGQSVGASAESVGARGRCNCIRCDENNLTR